MNNKWMFYFIRNCKIIYSVYTILHAHEQCMRVLVVLELHSTCCCLFFFFFFFFQVLQYWWECGDISSFLFAFP